MPSHPTLPEGAMRDFRVVKSTQQTRQKIRKFPIAAVESTLYGSTSSTKHPPSPVSDVSDRVALPVMEGKAGLANALELLSTRWRTGAGSALALLKHPDLEEWSKRSIADQGPVLFCLIEALVPEEEQLELCKEFLQEDLLAQRQPDYPHRKWRESWDNVLQCEDWEEARGMLYNDGRIAHVAGDKFLSCALIVLAEHHLRDCKDRIESPETPRKPLRHSCDLDHCGHQRSPADRGVHGEECAPQTKYIDILKEFRDLPFTVDLSFYKYALDIIGWDAQGNAKPEGDSLAVAEEHRRKYLEIINQNNLAHGKVGHVVPAPQTSPLTDSATSSNTFVTPERPTTSSSNTTMYTASLTARSAFDTLYIKWKTLAGFDEYAISLLTHDGTAVSIFELANGNGGNNENLFALIASTVSQEEQMKLVGELLQVFAAVKLTSQYSPWSMSWWCSVAASPTWDVFLKRCDLERIGEHLERIMGLDGARLLMDAMVLLVGERLMGELSKKLVAMKRQPGYLESAKYQDGSAQYTAILRTIMARRIKFDQSWLNYHLNIM